MIMNQTYKILLKHKLNNEIKTFNTVYIVYYSSISNIPWQK